MYTRNETFRLQRERGESKLSQVVIDMEEKMNYTNKARELVQILAPEHSEFATIALESRAAYPVRNFYFLMGPRAFTKIHNIRKGLRTLTKTTPRD